MLDASVALRHEASPIRARRRTHRPAKSASVDIGETPAIRSPAQTSWGAQAAEVRTAPHENAGAAR